MQVEEMNEQEVVDAPEENVEVVENESDSNDAQEDDDELVVSIGDEKPEEEAEEVKQAPTWVKELRKTSREQQKRIKELERELQTKAAPEPAKPTLGPRPTLEGCDYDEEKYNQAIDAWYDKKRQVEAVEAEEKATLQQAEQAWKEKLASYGNAKADLRKRVRNFDDAEHVVISTLSELQQQILVDGAKEPAMLVAALGNNPKLAAELAAIKRPDQFIWALARKEAEMTVTKSRKAPPPERSAPSGSAAISGSVDSTLERLRAEAAKTGDYSKVIAHKNAQKQKAR